MKNIHVLSTNKPSRLHYSKIKNNDKISYKLVLKKELSICNDGLLSGQRYIYITSDEEIKEGDVVKIPCGVGKVKKLNWKFGNDNPSYIVEDIFIYKLRYGQKEGELQINSFRYEDVKKIILTTDQDLIEDGVQEIDDEFLEWFIKNPNCEEIEVVDVRSLGVYGSYYPYKINIPKKETKQETLEEAKFNNLIKLFGKDFDLEPSSEIKNCNESFMAGVKWQQEQEQSNENSWFNEYQEVENYIIKRIGNKFLEATPDKYKTASEATIALLENNWKKENMYSEEDLREAFRQGELNINYSEMYGLDSELTEQQWFEQFSKLKNG